MPITVVSLPAIRWVLASRVLLTLVLSVSARTEQKTCKWLRFNLFYALDAPDNTTVSEDVVYVQEETVPGRVICKSRANPGTIRKTLPQSTFSMRFFWFILHSVFCLCFYQNPPTNGSSMIKPLYRAMFLSSIRQWAATIAAATFALPSINTAVTWPKPL